MNPIHLILIGDELLSGQRRDLHLQTLASDLVSRGAKVTSCEIIRDEEGQVADCVRRLLAPGTIIITTGGLGPTLDDLTREGIAQATGVPLREETSLWEDLKHRFERAGRKISSSNRSQALVPARGTYFRNGFGTAPGLVFEPEGYPGARVIALPGPPRELNPMWRDQALPYLAECCQLPLPPLEVLLRFCQMGESRIDEVMRPFLAPYREIELSSLIRLARVDVALRLPADHPNGREILTEIADKTASAFAEYVYERREYSGEERTRPLELEEVVSLHLRRRGQFLAAAESCTGGLLAKWITDFPGSSDIFLGGIVSYHNDLKQDVLHVSPEILNSQGAVSEAAARQMVLGLFASTRADWGIATSGIAGPGGGTPEKPVGLVWVAVGDHERVDTHRFDFPGDREAIREWAAVVALRLLWRRLVAGAGQ
jgi:nicotinamide-nucleotide amidase